jgi:hypothetical protein
MRDIHFADLGHCANAGGAAGGGQMDRATKLRGESGGRCCARADGFHSGLDRALLLGFRNHRSRRPKRAILWVFAVGPVKQVIWVREMPAPLAKTAAYSA